MSFHRVHCVASMSLAALICALRLSAADIPVPAGGDFQAALFAARPGDTITLAAGATYAGPFSLPVNPGTDWITVRGSSDASLAPGTRVSPSSAALMPKLTGPNGNAAVIAGPGSHNFRFTGLEFAPTPGSYSYTLIACGLGTETTVDQLPQFIEFDRDYIHGDPVAGSKRGVSMNCRSLTVKNSYLSDFKSTTQDAQAMAGWNGPGPFTIANNFLEASGEDIIFGGALPAIPNVIASDILIRNNYFYKPLSWKLDDPSTDGQNWIIKNHIEIKNAQRVTIDGNVLRNNWAQGDQGGYSIALSVVAEGGNAPWATIQDVSITRNIITHSQAGIGMNGTDIYSPAPTPGNPNSQGMGMHRVAVQNNLFTDIFADSNFPGATGRLFEVVNGSNRFVFDHNTVFQLNAVIGFGGILTSQIDYTNNLTTMGNCAQSCGFTGDNTAAGNATLNFWDVGGLVTNNVLAGGSAQTNPPGNFFPLSLNDVGFTDLANQDYHLAPSSPYKHAATDGKDIGADIDSIQAATAGVTGGNPTGTLTCATDITTQVSVYRSGFFYNRATHRLVQHVTVTNTSPSMITGPVSVAVDRLKDGVSLANRSEVTSCNAPVASPYADLAVGAGLGPGQSATVQLEYTTAMGNAATSFTRVLSGTGTR